MSKSRDIRLDTLKTIGMLTIILAHCRGLPAWVNYLRNFEVILLVLVSGALQGEKIFANVGEYLHYAGKRMKRLVFPTWVFLTILFAGIWTAGKLLGQPFPYSPWVVAESYLLLGGVGYVWIMSVYCLAAVGAPILHTGLHSQSTGRKMLALAALWIVYEVVRHLVLHYTGVGVVNYLLKNVFLYAVGYSLLCVLGHIVYSTRSRKNWLLAAGLLVVHGVVQIVAIAQNGVLISLDTCKYPLSFVYVSYALGAALLIMLMTTRCLPTKIGGVAGRFVTFIGKHSAWIYFHHVFLIFVWNMVIDKQIWYVMYIFLCVGAMMLTYLQNRVVLALAKRLPQKTAGAIQFLFG